MLHVGLIDSGQIWAERFRSAIDKLDRLRVAAVCSQGWPRTVDLAERVGTVPCEGVRKLLKKPKLRGVLILDPGWHGLWTAKEAARLGIPVFLAVDAWRRCPRAIVALREITIRNGATVIPEMPLRYAPAVLRLRELIATRLGPVTDVQGEVSAANLDLVLDLCRALASPNLRRLRGPDQLGDSPAPTTSSTTPIMLVADTGGGRVTCRLSVSDANVSTDTPKPVTSSQLELPPLTIRCRVGEVRLLGLSQLSWSVGSEQYDEDLQGEKSSEERSLDQFCRRALGALIPTPTIEDLLLVQALLN